MEREYCSNHPSLSQYAVSSNCSLSWVTMIVNAGERVLAQMGINERLSVDFVLQCYNRSDICEGMTMNEIATRLRQIGLVREEDAKHAMDEGESVCSIPLSQHYRFDVQKPEGYNRGGLMNLVSAGNPVLVAISMDLLQLRFVKDMREEEEVLRRSVYQPSIYGLVTGYVKTTEEVDGYWVFEGTPSPCESVNVKLPMRANETNTDFAGIAGYAFAIALKGGIPTTVAPTTVAPTTVAPSVAPTTVTPTTVAPTTVAPTTVAPTSIPLPTAAPTTVAPTTVAPTTVAPTTIPPTTVAPTTVAPTTVAPTTVAPTTVAPTTVAPTTVAPTTVAPTTVAPTTVAPTSIPLPTAAPTTVAPTTVAPTTVAPTTVAPTTVAPTTVAPTTVAPTTVAPTTVAPTTVAPTTVAPTTVAPTTVAPTSIPLPTAAPTTVAPTTVAPTTVAPTTVAPTTVAPTTVAPTTVAPTTVAPTTVAPTTVAPTTVAPTTVAPTTVAPTSIPLPTAAPTTVAPTTVAPTTVAPTTVAPTTVAPTTVAPTTVAPTTVAPTTVAPTTVAPTTVAPTTVAPTTVAPTTVAPTTVAPTTVAPTTVAPTTVAPTTVAPTTVAPTTVAPTTVAPTTVAPTTVAPTPTLYPITADECWSDTPVPLNVEVIIVGDGMCNGDNNRIDLSKYVNLKNVSIGNRCFKNQDVLNLTGLHSLERVMIGENSFTKENWRNDTNRKLYVKNCDALKELKIGRRSFFDYSLIEIENVNSLELIEMGEVNSFCYNFCYASLELKNLPKLKSLLFGDGAFCYSSRLVLENLPELTSIRLGWSAFRFDDDKSSTLVMRNLPSLTSLTTTSVSWSFRYPRHITLYDIPALTTVTLPKAFDYKNDVSTNCNIGELKTFFTDQCPA
ncbi:hypothetical protein WA577_000487 [Blastocystis sp. JDR]